MTETKPTSLSPTELGRVAAQLEADGKIHEARDTYELALRADPESQSLIEGRARLAIQLREDDAAFYCNRALGFHDHDPDLQMQMIATAAVELGAASTPLLESYLDRHPNDVRAHELLADLRAQAGAGEQFVESYDRALKENPGSQPLLLSYWSMLSRSGRHQQALESMDANRSKFSNSREFTMLEIAIAGHSGLTDRAARLLEGMDQQADAQLARALNRMQSGLASDAATLLEDIVAAQPDNFEAWAILEFAWRITHNPKHDWLIGQSGLFGPCALNLDDAKLADIAAHLRTLHRTSAQPIGQSVRGGTQTSGQLFMRSEPAIELLLGVLATAIRDFVGKLPAADPRHPLLKHRDSPIAFGPSWSIRFTGSGHHAAHFHPGGVLSSACYIVVPDAVSDQQTQSGWLEIGRPPPEIGMDMPALATFEPKPGRLILFPSFLFHGTRPFAGGERLTVAFDLVPVKVAG